MVEQPYDFQHDDDISDVSSSDNFDNTPYNSKNNQHMTDTLNNYFDTHRFSIADSLKPYKFSLACHNVRGLMNPAKQSQILSAFESKHLDILGISETKLSLAALIHNFKNTDLLSSWWSHHPSRQTSGGVGLIIRQPLDRKSTRLNSSHTVISYAVFCLKKKKETTTYNNNTRSNEPTCSTYYC